MSNKKLPSGLAAIDGFRAKGWSYRTAAERLGVSANHLHQVLRGTRHSRRLLARVADLPVRSN